ncbi:MAG: PEP-CTERM sorting domain-containing protein [Candidatus Brocadiae bacterium]|nr:PEP-CTERM sorting domain-containing protein [Candidatus Brocadiia bacterium]
MKKNILIALCCFFIMSVVQAYTINYYQFGSTSNASTVNSNWGLQLQALGLNSNLNVENFDDSTFNSDIQIFDAADNAWTYSVYSSWRVTGNGLYVNGAITNSSQMNALGVNFSQGGVMQFAVHLGALDATLNIYINDVLSGTFLGHSSGRDYNQIMTIQAATGEAITSLKFFSQSSDGFIYDNLSYGVAPSSVPEPASFLLMALAAAFYFVRKL